MSFRKITNEKELLSALSEDEETVVGFFGEFSEASRRALPAFEAFSRDQGERPIYAVDVGVVRGLHQRFGVTSVPTVLRLKGESVLSKLVGADTADGYAAALSSGAAPAAAGSTGSAKRQHNVRVYVTDTCPWCTRVKAYLRQNHVPFREVNVSHNESAAREMVRRSGQQGVPQVDIDGRMVIGFDKGRIDSLLGLGRS